MNDQKVVRQIFKNNFSTIAMFKCVRKEFALDLINGNIYFNTPSSWIREEQEGNKGRGDVLEGTILSAHEKDASKFISNLKKNKTIEFFAHKGYIFFRKKQIKKYYCTCFYGLSTNQFEKNIDALGKATFLGKIGKEYFSDFSDNITKEKYEAMQDKEKPVVVLISNPNEFFRRIKVALNQLGIPEEKVIISPVEYVNKYMVSYADIPSPLELLLKDDYYVGQSEIRIIINSLDDVFLKKMQSLGNKIHIGNLEGIVQIFDYYFDDMLVAMTKEKQLMFTLPHPVERSFEDMDLDELIDLYLQIDKELLPNSNGTMSKGDKKQKELDGIREIIEKKYNIIFRYENNQIQIYNADKTVFTLIDKMRSCPQNVEMFENKMRQLLKEEKFDEAKDYLNEARRDDDGLRNISRFYEAKLNEIEEKFENAIECYSCCINRNIHLKDSLSGRSNSYSRIGMYNNALEDLNELQEIVGYNHQIYSNKGIALVGLRRYREAIEAFDKSLELEKHNAFAYYNRSVTFFKLSDYTNAKRDILKALELEPSNEFYRESYDTFYKTL